MYTTPKNENGANLHNNFHHNISNTQTIHHQGYKSKNKIRYYTNQEVQKMVKMYLQPKIEHLKQHMTTMQQTISILNDKLHENDHQIQKQRKIIEMLQYYSREQNNLVMNKIKEDNNSKIQSYWEKISQKIRDINQQLGNNQTNRSEQTLQKQIKTIKTQIHKQIQQNKKKNNAYWLKLKDNMMKIYVKISTVEQKTTQIEEKIFEQKQKQEKYRSQVMKIKQGCNSIRKISQLSKSINNMYENYEIVLELQQKFKNRIEQRRDESILSEQQLSLSINPLAKYYEKKDKNYSRSKRIRSTKYQSDKFQDLQQLQYSKEDEIVQSNKKNQNIFNSRGTSQKHQYYIREKTQKSKKIAFNVSPLSKNLSNSEYMGESILSSQMQKLNSRSTSMMNLSLDTRKQMTQQVRKRLLELIEIKSMQIPLEVTLDGIKYLKNADGNYLFDLHGNMFKVNDNEFSSLCDEGLLLCKKTSTRILKNRI